MYLLKTVSSTGKAHNDFQWPLEVDQLVEAPDFDPKPQCGGGLHGALDGEGDGSLFRWDDKAIWIAAEIPSGAQVVDLGGKVKVDRCITRCVGDRQKVTAWLAKHRPGKVIIGATVIAGYKGTATAGDWGTATAGDWGTATAGDWGTATAGDWGTATAGDWGTATAGDNGTATAGEMGTIIIKYWDGERCKLAVAYVGENGIKPNVAYELDDNLNFVEASPNV